MKQFQYMAFFLIKPFRLISDNAEIIAVSAKSKPDPINILRFRVDFLISKLSKADRHGVLDLSM